MIDNTWDNMDCNGIICLILMEYGLWDHIPLQSPWYIYIHIYHRYKEIIWGLYGDYPHITITIIMEKWWFIIPYNPHIIPLYIYNPYKSNHQPTITITTNVPGFFKKPTFVALTGRVWQVWGGWMRTGVPPALRKAPPTNWIGRNSSLDWWWIGKIW